MRLTQISVLAALAVVTLSAATPALVQQTNNYALSASSVVLTLGFNTTTGQTLIVKAGVWGAPTVSSVSGGGVTSWSKAKAAQNGTSTDCEIWYGNIASGSSTPVTVTLSGIPTIVVGYVSQWSGLASSSPVDASNSNTGTGTTITTGTVTTTAATDVVIGAEASQTSGYASGPTNSFTEFTNAAFSSTAAAYQIESSMGTYSTGYTITSAAWSAVIVAFLPIPTPALYLNPAVPNTNTSTTLVLTGVNTSWNSQTPATLFSLTGSTGASLGTPTIASNTSATATLTVGSTAGVLTVTDNSTSAVASIQINKSGGAAESYMECTFPAVAQTFQETTSGDGLNWTTQTNVPSISGVRDPSCLQLDNGTWVMAYNDNTQGNVSTITLYAGRSVAALTFVGYVTVKTGEDAWAPFLFIPPVAGRPLCMNVSSPGYAIYLLCTSQSDIAPAAWSAAASIYNYSVNSGYDGVTIWPPNTTTQFYLFYVVNGSGLYYGTSVSYNGTFAGATALVAGNYESPIPVYSSITGWRLYFTEAGGDNGGFYVQMNLIAGAFSVNGEPTRFYTNGSTQTQHGTILNLPLPTAWLGQ